MSNSSSVPESLNKSHVDVLQTIPDAWMLRECQCYYDELRACQSLKGRFYQFYIDGAQGDCSQWSENHADCKLWTNNADVEAAKRVIGREKERIKERLRGHYENDVWEKRDQPPSKEEWSKPLPQYMVDRQEKSYLTLWAKAQENKDDNKLAEMKALSMTSTITNSVPSCAIM